MTTTFCFIRHAESVSNLKGLINGQTDTQLTTKGVSQAKKFSKILEHKKIRFDVYVSSDLARASKTAKLITKGLNKNIAYTKLLRERSFGEFEGKPRSFLKIVNNIYPLLTDEEKFTYKFSNNIESNKDVYLRTIKFIKSMHKKFLGKTILAVTHGGLITVLLNQIGYTSHNKPIRILNLGSAKVDYNGKNIRLKEVRDIFYG